jgi:MFS family permease
MSVATVGRPVAAQAETSKPKGRWSALWAMAFGFMADGTEGGLVNTLFPVIQASLGLQLTALGLMTSISRFARMIFGPLWSVVADKYGRKRILFLVTGLWGAWIGLAGLAQDFTQLLILYTIGVIGTVASEPIANGILGDLFEENERGKAFGAIRMASSFGALVLTPLIGQLSRVEDGWRIGLFIMGGISVLSGILILIFVDDPKQHVKGEQGKSAEGDFKFALIGQIMKTPTILLLATQLLLITSLVLFSFMVVYFVQVRGWENADAAILYSVFMGGFMLSSLAGGLLGDRFDKRFGPKGRIMLMQLYLVAFSVMSFVALQMDWGHSPATYVVVFVFGLVGSLGFSGAVLPMVSAVVPAAASATAFALLFSLIQGLISAVMSLWVGYAGQALGLQPVLFWLVTVPYAANALFWFLFYPVYPKDVAKQTAERAAIAKADAQAAAQLAPVTAL